MECLGSVLTNKYSEGQPHQRYYGGCEFIDKVENLCKERALKAYRLNNGIGVLMFNHIPEVLLILLFILRY